MSPLGQQAARLKSWTINSALPFWQQHGRDALGGFYEYLHPDKSPASQAVRRLRVQARQVYVYALAYKLGWYKDGDEVARTTFKFMCDKGYRPDGAPGFIHLLNPDYSVNNDRRDLYDHAFYILACSYMGSHGAQISKDIQNFIQTQLGSPYGGWREGKPESIPASPRRQNPHMHLFEAALEGYRLSGDQAWLDNWAHPVFKMFQRHFFDKNTNTIREFFTPKWHTWPAPKGESAEPGHAAEWVWLLGLYQRQTGINCSAYTQPLYDHMLMSRPGFLYDEEDIHARIRRSTGRLWVQTELIKAHLSQTQRGIDGCADMAAAAIEGLFDKYLRPDGTWIDQIDKDGRAVAKTIPVSTFYHIICMAAEAQRVFEALEAA